MKLSAMALVGLMMCGCGKRPDYYRFEVDGGYTYWREFHKTTFHGLCANVYGARDTWEVDHPSGSKLSPNGDGAYVSTNTEIRIFKSKEEAYAWAESVCPTKKASVTK